MTIHTVRPGCFGSVVFYNVNASQCVECPYALECATDAQDRKRSAFRHVVALDALFRAERAQELGRWFVSRFVKDTSKDRKRTRSRNAIAYWSGKGLNLFHLKHRNNPCGPETLPEFDLHREAFNFILEVKVFTARDIAEHLREEFPDVTKSMVAKLAKLICEVLLDTGIVAKEGRTLCLK